MSRPTFALLAAMLALAAAGCGKNSKKAATRTCSVAAMPAAVGDMCSKRTVVRLMAWATVTPFYGVAALAASLWVRTYRRPRARSVPASH